MKLRMAGSVVQTRRSAARVSSNGTPGARKALMSEAPSIDSIGGRGAGARASTVVGEAGFARSATLGGGFFSASDCAAALRFRLDQRARKDSSPLIAPPDLPSLSCQSLRIGAVALALTKPGWAGYWAMKAAIASRTDSGITTASTIA